MLVAYTEEGIQARFISRAPHKHCLHSEFLHTFSGAAGRFMDMKPRAPDECSLPVQWEEMRAADLSAHTYNNYLL